MSQKPNVPAVKDENNGQTSPNFNLLGIGIGILAYLLTVKLGPPLYEKATQQ